MRLIGIDPGKSGGVAEVEFTTGGLPQLSNAMRMPLLKDGKRDLVDTRLLSTNMFEALLVDAIVVERVHSMPKQGVASSFNFGRHAGAVEGWAVATGKPIFWASPSQWKGALGLSKDKRASLDLARLTFGDDELWSVLANDGIAEAALLCIYAQKYLLKFR